MFLNTWSNRFIKQVFKQCLEKNDYDYDVINKNIALLHLQQNNIIKFVKYARQAKTYKFDIEMCNLLAEKYEILDLMGQCKDPH